MTISFKNLILIIKSDEFQYKSFFRKLNYLYMLILPEYYDKREKKRWEKIKRRRAIK